MKSKKAPFPRPFVSLNRTLLGYSTLGCEPISRRAAAEVRLRNSVKMLYFALNVKHNVKQSPRFQACFGSKTILQTWKCAVISLMLSPLNSAIRLKFVLWEEGYRGICLSSRRMAKICLL